MLTLSLKSLANEMSCSLVVQILEASSIEEAEALQARLTELQVEHCCLCNLMITSNTRLFGPWKHQWSAHKELKEDVCGIMVSRSLRCYALSFIWL